jgi:hypothetical protein
VSVFRADSLDRYVPQCAWESNVFAMDKTYLIELVRDVTPLWDKSDKNYHNRDLKPILWDEIGEKLNVNVISLCVCLCLYIYSLLQVSVALNFACVISL